MKVVQIFPVNQQIQHIVAWNESRLLLKLAFIFEVKLFVKVTFFRSNDLRSLYSLFYQNKLFSFLLITFSIVPISVMTVVEFYFVAIEIQKILTTKWTYKIKFDEHELNLRFCY